MAQFKRLEVYNQLQRTPVVPVFYHGDFETAKEILKACYDGGARVFEFTNRGDGAHRVFRKLVEFAKAELPYLILGVGSVVDEATTAIFIQNGANFVVSPIMNPEMAKICNRRKVAWLPGCGSVSEISVAEEFGAEVVKMFPAPGVGGPDFIKAVKGPMPWTNIMPSGGVEAEENNLKQWFSAGAFCVGLGTKAFVQKPDGTFDYNAITNNFKYALDFAKQFRQAN